MENNENNTRIPRPLGATSLAIKYQNTNQEQDKSNLYNYIITSYLQQGYSLNNQSLSIYDLAYFFKIPVPIIHSQLKNSKKNIAGIINPNDLNSTLESLIYLTINWSIEDRGRILQQYHTISESQGGKYKPFISSELNKTLKLLLESNGSISSILKSIQGGSSTSIQILNANVPVNKQKEGITTQEALELMESNIIDTKESPTTLQAIYDENNIADTPDTFSGNVRKGPDSLKLPVNEAVTLSGHNELKLPKEDLETASKHEKRREDSYEIDSEEQPISHKDR